MSKPTLIQRASALGKSCAFLQNVVEGNLLVVVYGWYSGDNTAAATDSVGTSYSAAVTKAASAKITILIGYAGGDGANTVTVTSGSSSYDQISISEWTGATTTVHKSASANGSGTTAASGGFTTTVNGCLIVAGTEGYTAGAAIEVTDQQNWEPLCSITGQDPLAAGYIIGTAAGTYADGFKLSSSQNWSTVSVALSPADSLSVVTSDLPDGAQTDAYSYTLEAHGGSGSYTWDVASGSVPGGLSLSSAGVISGTPNSSGTSTFTARVTDGSSNTATKSLSIGIADSYQTISVLQTKSTTGATNTVTFDSNVAKDSLILVICFTAKGLKVISPPSVTDSLDTVYQKLKVTSGNHIMWIDVWAGIAPSGGANTVTVSNYGTTCYELTAIEIENAQIITDGLSTKWNFTSPDPMTSDSITTTLDGDLLLSVMGQYSPLATLTIDAPFSLLTHVHAGGGFLETDTYSPGAEGSYTASYTRGTSCQNYVQMLIGIRPSIVAPAAGGNFWPIILRLLNQ